MPKYIAIYEDKNAEIVSTAYFNADNISKAKASAQMHKRRTPEIVKAKGVKTMVRRMKDED